VDIAKQNLDYATIKAPLAGRAGRRLVDPGNLIRQGRDQLVVINQIQPIKVRFSLSAEYLDEIKDFQSKDPLKVQAVIPGYDGPPEHGQLTFVNNQINPKTGMIDLEATFPNQKRALWPGQFVKTRLVLTEQKNLTIAPYRGVQKGPQGYYAFVVQDDQTVKTQPVKIGRRMDEEVVIESGLKPGQKVVVDGQLTLRNGSKIKEAKSSTDSKKGGSQSSSDVGGSSGGQG
jgi:multidrug efflux system membrane fusion protein